MEQSHRPGREGRGVPARSSSLARKSVGRRTLEDRPCYPIRSMCTSSKVELHDPEGRQGGHSGLARMTVRLWQSPAASFAAADSVGMISATKALLRQDAKGPSIKRVVTCREGNLLVPSRGFALATKTRDWVRYRASRAAISVAGIAPLIREASRPLRKRIIVGIPRIEKRCATSGSLSVSTLATTTSARLPAIFSISGATAWQGPHHVAQKSTRTGLGESLTISSKSPLLATAMECLAGRRASLHAAQRARSLRRLAGSRFDREHEGQTTIILPERAASSRAVKPGTHNHSPTNFKRLSTRRSMAIRVP
jgi:hypothetical protein